MHFITGGAYNGKRQWVKRYYTLDHSLWLSAYNGSLPNKFEHTELPFTVIVEGVEQWIYRKIDSVSQADKLVENFMNDMDPWLQWKESDSRRKVVIIGTDISKGIVPIDKQDRLWRDVTGWAYQELVRRAERVDVIWYGIEQTIKGWER